MQKESTFIPSKAPYNGRRFNRFGMLELAKIIASEASEQGPLGWSRGHDDQKRLVERIESFFSQFETDMRTIKKRQKLFSALIEDTELVSFLLKKGYPRFPDRRSDSPHYSRTNDEMAIGTVEYLKKLQELLVGKPAYANFRKKLSEISEKKNWLKQMEVLAENAKKYSNYSIKLKVEITPDYCEGETKRSYDFKSQNYQVSFISKDSKVPMYNRMNGSFTLEKKDKKVSTDYISINQETGVLDQSLWKKLFQRAINDYGWKQIWPKKDETDSVAVDITVYLKGRNITALVGFGNMPMRKLKLVICKSDKPYYSDYFAWVNENERYKKGKEDVESVLKHLNTYKDDHVMVGSRSFIYSYVDEFRDIFYQIDEMLMLAAIAHFYQTLKGKWVVPKLLPMESMTTKIASGCNPLFYFKGDKQCVPNDAVFNKSKNGFLITGANTGGKTGYTNMVALNQMLAQAGLPVFAESAVLSLKDKILCHYVETEDIGVNFSRYQSELHRLREIVGELTRYTIVLFDEPFSGTGVESGTHQAHEVLRVLSKVGCVFIMNTHFHQLVDIVGVNGTSSVLNIHFNLPDKEKPSKDDYKVLSGGSKLSQGEAISISEKVDYRSMMKDLRKRKVFAN